MSTLRVPQASGGVHPAAASLAWLACRAFWSCVHDMRGSATASANWNGAGRQA